MTELRYRAHADPTDLAPGECTIRSAAHYDGRAGRWWMLWFCVLRESDGQPEVDAVAVAPGGVYCEQGVGGRTWGFKHDGPGRWQVSPSIHVLEQDPTVPQPGPDGKPVMRTAWHQTPAVVGVPDGEPWASEATP
jgi:hypothetical protein